MNIRPLFFLGLTSLSASSSIGLAAPETNISPFGNVAPGYTLSWSDEFNDVILAADKWSYRTDSKMWSTQLPENISVENGSLKIALKKEDARGKQYTGGGVISKHTFQYGYYEARFKVPPDSGWHTSFWTMAYDGVGTKPQATQEIDICEQDSVNTKTYSAGIFAWGDGGQSLGRKYTNTPDLSADFHVWGCEYTPQAIKFFFDGKLTHQLDPGTIKQGPQSIWLTCIACSFGNTRSVDEHRLPASAEFDYVRFFKNPKTDGGSPSSVPEGKVN